MTQLLSGGYSPEAEFVNKQLGQQRTRSQSSSTFGRPAAFDELLDVWNECKEANWDGYDANPMSRQTRDQACRLLEMLSSTLPSPSFGAEPDGALTMEWYRKPGWVLSVSVDGTDALHYAALLGKEKSYGTCRIVEGFPRRIADLIREVSGL